MLNIKQLLLTRVFRALLIFTAVLLATYPVSPLYATVTGSCSNCHTMHNSQDGSEMIAGGPHDHLTIDSCVGCHSSTSSNTIETLGSSDLPIVYNSLQPVNHLAGGNFFWLVNESDDRLGHNVSGIAGEDGNLLYIPGRQIGGDDTLSITDCYNCHSAGFPPHYPGIPFTVARAGNVLICEDCHTQVMHHADDSATVVDGTGGWYRFLYDVSGIEDPDWEKTVSEFDHNEYQGETAAFNGSISDGGCGCHGDFHALKNPTGVGSGSPWLRHPVDVALPAEGEYTAYTTYNPTAPVARPDLSGYSGPNSVVNPGVDQVMCLSCHRPHGTDQPDLLRWEYDTMIANGDPNSSGCFICHSTKDDGT